MNRSTTLRHAGLLGASALALAGCQIYHTPDTNQFYRALGYTPDGDPALTSRLRPLSKGDATTRCAAVETVDPSLPGLDSRQFRLRPGMVLQVHLAGGRLSGASEVPILSTWTWRLPPSQKGCPEGGGWTASDIITLRALVHGARLNAGTSAKRFDLWQQSVRCAVGGGKKGEDDCELDEGPQGADGQTRLAVNLLDAVVAQTVMELRSSEAAPELRGATGASRRAEADCQPQALDLPEAPAPSATDPNAIAKSSWADLVKCLDPAVLDDATQTLPAVCAHAHKRLITLGDGYTPLTKTPLELLTTADPFGLAAPRPLRSMASPAYDLNHSPGDGVSSAGTALADAQRPLGGDAYQGFVDFDVLIPVRISGHKQPVLVSVCATVKSVAKAYGPPNARVERVSRLAEWMPGQIVLATGEAPISVDKVTWHDGRVHLRFGDTAWANKALWLKAADTDDLLIAPDDMIVLAR